MTSPLVHKSAGGMAAGNEGAGEPSGPGSAVRELAECRALLRRRRNRGHATAAAARLLETGEGFIRSGNFIVGLGYVRRARGLLEAMR